MLSLSYLFPYIKMANKIKNHKLVCSICIRLCLVFSYIIIKIDICDDHIYTVCPEKGDTPKQFAVCISYDYVCGNVNCVSLCIYLYFSVCLCLIGE